MSFLGHLSSTQTILIENLWLLTSLSVNQDGFLIALGNELNQTMSTDTY